MHCGASPCHSKADRGLSIFVLSWLNICLATVDPCVIFSSAARLLRLCRVLLRRLLLLLLGTFYFFRCRLEPSVLHTMVRSPEMLTCTHAERCVTSDIGGAGSSTAHSTVGKISITGVLLIPGQRPTVAASENDLGDCCI